MPGAARDTIHCPQGRASGSRGPDRWRRASLSWLWSGNRPMAAGPPGRAAARFIAIIAAGKSAVSAQPAPSPFSWPRLRQCRRSGAAPSPAAGNRPLLRPHPAGSRAGNGRTAAFPITRRCCRRWRATSRICNEPRTAQDEPAADGQRQCEGHRGAQGEPGRDEARARKGSRAGPAQDATATSRCRRRRLRPCAGPSDRRRRRERGLDTRGSGCTTIGSRRTASTGIRFATTDLACHREARGAISAALRHLLFAFRRASSSHLPISGSGRSL